MPLPNLIDEVVHNAPSAKIAPPVELANGLDEFLVGEGARRELMGVSLRASRGRSGSGPAKLSLQRCFQRGLVLSQSRLRRGPVLVRVGARIGSWQ